MTQVISVIASLVCNLESKPIPTPRGWAAVTTSIHSQQHPDGLAEYAIEEERQNVAAHVQRPFLVFPGGSVRR